MGQFSDLSTLAMATGWPVSLLLSCIGTALVAWLVLFPPRGGNDEDDGGSGGGGLMQPAYATVRRGR